MKEGIGSFARVPAVFGPAGPIHLLEWTAPNGIERARMRSLLISDKGDRSWTKLAELGWTRRSTLKHIFQLHGMNAAEMPVLRKKLPVHDQHMVAHKGVLRMAEPSKIAEAVAHLTLASDKGDATVRHLVELCVDNLEMMQKATEAFADIADTITR